MTRGTVTGQDFYLVGCTTVLHYARRRISDSISSIQYRVLLPKGEAGVVVSVKPELLGTNSGR